MITRLAQDGVVDDDDGVRAQNVILRTTLRNHQRLFPRQSFGTVSRRLSRQRRFVDISRLHREWNAGVAQQILAAW